MERGVGGGRLRRRFPELPSWQDCLLALVSVSCRALPAAPHLFTTLLIPVLSFCFPRGLLDYCRLSLRAGSLGPNGYSGPLPCPGCVAGPAADGSVGSMIPLQGVAASAQRLCITSVLQSKLGIKDEGQLATEQGRQQPDKSAASFPGAGCLGSAVLGWLSILAPGWLRIKGSGTASC